ncbi:MAG TPA: hypothetical protein VK327_14170 [Candidatus Paceibacterota bacterium]|nr:hypothetical protein [Candidatus Paceibacterota bacterium]
MKNREEADRHQQQADPQYVIGHDDSGNEKNGAQHSPKQAALKTDISTEETHTPWLAQVSPEVKKSSAGRPPGIRLKTRSVIALVIVPVLGLSRIPKNDDEHESA